MPQVVVQRHNLIMYGKPFFSDRHSQNQLASRISHEVFSFVSGHVHQKLCLGREKIEPIIKRSHRTIGLCNIGVANDCQEDLSEEDDDLCPVECVKEFKTDEEFHKILEKAKEAGSLVVVDFFRTSCGSCKYIEQGFSKLCKKSGDHEAPVIFLKHNVIDEYDEQSEVADRLRIRSVPLFHFYKNGDLVESFATRDKERIIEALLKHSSHEVQDILS